jgi:hypothetical protein
MTYHQNGTFLTMKHNTIDEKQGDESTWRHNLLLLSVLLAHVLMALLPSVNLEFAFVDAARYFSSHDKQLLDQYFSYQANTLGIPWLAWLLSLALPGMQMLVTVRLLSIAGIVLFAIGFLRISRYVHAPASPGLLALLLLNPLVWIYAGRGTADFLPAAVGIFAVSMALHAGRSPFQLLLAGIVLGIAGILKYHVLSLSLCIFALLWARKPDRWFWVPPLTVTATALALLAAYLMQVHTEFGFWVTPERFQTVHQLNLGSMVSNTVAYAGFLVLLALPLSLAWPGATRWVQRHWMWLLPAGLAVVLAGAYGIQDNGEMNLGPLDRWVPPPVVSGIFLLLSLGCIGPICAASGPTTTPRPYRKMLGLAILAILLAFATSRPAQRYLLPVLPLFLLALPQPTLRRPVWVGTCMVFMLVNVFVGYSQWCTGTAAEKMAQAITQAGWIQATDPGAIDGHVGNRFRATDRAAARYTVVQGAADGAVISIRSGPLLGKSFSLVPVQRTEK